MRTYVLTVSKSFPSYHIKAGKPTWFPEKIEHKEKIHTIRGNYELWRKRFEKIDKGEAFLSVRVWEGKPYNTKQVEVFRFDKSHGIGIEKIVFDDYLYSVEINGTRRQFSGIDENDGLSHADFESWFKKVGPEPMVIIHFTDFRYDGTRTL